MRVAIWGLSGDAHSKEWGRFGVFFRSRRRQKWSPLLTEVAEDFGIRIGHIRLMVTLTHKHFHDGKSPAVVPGAL